MKILICDDLPKKSDDFREAIRNAKQQGLEIDRLFGKELKEQLNELIKRADNIFEGQGRSSNPYDTKFDEDVDLIVLDNNLADLRIEGARLTAEAVVGYIRAFSSALYILSINKNPDVDFDLRYLLGDYRTRADLALNTHHLSNPALWTRQRKDATEGFLPWYWPKLLDVGDRRRKQIEFVEGHLEQRVGASLGLVAEDFDALSRQARSLLSQAEEAIPDVTVDGQASGAEATFAGVFLASQRSLPDQSEREALLKRVKDDQEGIKTIIARVVAADIDFWFRREVLGPQEVLVDIPHLLMRMPFLLGGQAGEIDAWNKAVDAANDEETCLLDQDLFEKHLKNLRLDDTPWVPTPSFLWTKLRENEELNSFFSKNNWEWGEAVFCEDRSDFLPIGSEDNPSSPREFVAQFEGTWNQRFVADIQGIRYSPKTRFAM